jgi:hypothetical protein
MVAQQNYLDKKTINKRRSSVIMQAIDGSTITEVVLS